MTYRQWMACLRDGGCGGYVPPDRIAGPNSPWVGGDHPVVRVSYLDAQAYVAWLNSALKTEAYRLPTEAEREYAARAGSTSRFAQGDELTAGQANFSRQATEFQTLADWSDLVDRKTVVPVTDLDAANAWGLRHMSGNAREITRSCYSDRYAEWPTSSRWLEESRRSCTERTSRGGGFSSPLDNLRAAWRISRAEDVRFYWEGFRIVKELGSPP